MATKLLRELNYPENKPKESGDYFTNTGNELYYDKSQDKWFVSKDYVEPLPVNEVSLNCEWFLERFEVSVDTRQGAIQVVRGKIPSSIKATKGGIPISMGLIIPESVDSLIDAGYIQDKSEPMMLQDFKDKYCQDIKMIAAYDEISVHRYEGYLTLFPKP